MSRRNIFGLCALTTIAVAMAAPFFVELYGVSMRNPYGGHVPFVPPLAGVLFWIERERLRGLVPVGMAPGVALTAAGLGGLIVAYRLHDTAIQAVSFVCTVAGLVVSWYGIRALRVSAFLLGFLFFTVPPPRDLVAALSPAVQRVVAVFSAFVLQALQVPVAVHDVFLRLPGITLHVAEECAGLRFALILVVCATAFARMVMPTRRGQLILVGSAIPIAMLANVVRVAATGAGVYLFGAHVATGPIHYYVGKGFYSLAMVAMIAIALLVRRERSHPGPIATGTL